MNCLVCGKKKFHKKKFYVTRDRFEKALKLSDSKRFWKICCYCNSATNFISKKNKDKLRLIGENYYEIDLGKNQIKSKYNKILNLKNNKSDNYYRVKRIIKFLNLNNSNYKKINILDIGTGLGVFPSKFYEMMQGKSKVNFFATETDKNILKHLKDLHFLNLISFEKKNINFKLITINKVLEHVEFPEKFLREIKYKFMNIDTLMYLEVPNTNNLKKKKDDNSLGSLHYNLYSSYGLNLLIKKIGMKIIFCKNIMEPSSKYSLIALIADEKNNFLIQEN